MIKLSNSKVKQIIDFENLKKTGESYEVKCIFIRYQGFSVIKCITNSLNFENDKIFKSLIFAQEQVIGSNIISEFFANNERTEWVFILKNVPFKVIKAKDYELITSNVSSLDEHIRNNYNHHKILR